MRTISKTLGACLALTLCAFACKENPQAQNQQGADKAPTPNAQATVQQQAPVDANAKNPFARTASVPNTTPMEVPRILWGGEEAGAYANGGKDATQPNSIFAELGLNVRFVPGDNFKQQIADYKSGRRNFLRGTEFMLGLKAAEVADDPFETVFQMTWSAGDHLVCRKDITTLADLKGKKVTLQKDGPHMGMQAAAVLTADMNWNDVNLAYVDDITGANGPAEKFRKDASVSCAYVVTPDAIGLVGDLDSVGSGAEGTVQGAHIVVSTRQMTRAIADVIAVRKSWLDANRETVMKFVAGYEKAIEEVLTLKADYETNGPLKAAYVRDVLRPAQTIFGSNVLPNDDEAHGLLSDAQFVGHKGNKMFFTEDPSNPASFGEIAKRATALAKQLGYAKSEPKMLASSLDWDSPIFTAYLKRANEGGQNKFDPEKLRAEVEEMSRTGRLASNTIYSFNIAFAPNQEQFEVEKYREKFKEAVRLARINGGATMVIRGNADTNGTLHALVVSGCANGTLQCDYAKKTYLYKGVPLNQTDITSVVELIKSGDFDRGVDQGPRAVMRQAQETSLRRAENVRKTLLAFAKQNKLEINADQFQAQGVGILEPVVAKPLGPADSAKNRRVEFTLIKVKAESAGDYNF